MTDREKSAIDATILRGAFAAWLKRDTIEDNPHPNAPGSYGLHKAWRYGFEHSEEIMAKRDAEAYERAKRLP